MNRPWRLAPRLQHGLTVVALLAGGGAALAWSVADSGHAAEVGKDALAPPLPELAVEVQDELARVQVPARRVAVLGTHAPVPAQAAPVYALSARGVLMTRRAASLPSGPATSAHELVAIVLPESSLTATGPEAKAALLALVARLGLRGERAASAIDLVGLHEETTTLVRLLRWMP